MLVDRSLFCQPQGVSLKGHSHFWEGNFIHTARRNMLEEPNHVRVDWTFIL